MIHRPSHLNAFEFVRVATLRAAQLMRGCTPRLAAGSRCTVTAQMEVASGRVAAGVRAVADPAVAGAAGK